MEAVKSYIFNISVAVILISAVEMILPDNKIKKYGKFVLGLILMVVILNPILKLFDKNFNITSYTEKAAAYFDNDGYKKDYTKYENSNINKTLEAASKNINLTEEKKLKEKFKGDYEVSTKVKLNNSTSTLYIEKVEVKILKGGVRPIKKIEIGKNKNESSGKEILDTKEAVEIKNFVCNDLGLNSDIVSVVSE